MSQHFLKNVPLFEDLDAADLDRLCALVEPVDLEHGELLFAEGSPGDKAYVVERGQLEILKQSGGREVLLALRGSGEVIGEMSLLDESPRMASVRARGATRLLAIEQDQMDALIRTSASAARSMFYTMLARWRSTGAMLRQSEKMAQLGTLTAGVAHELNNPAAAVQRGTEQLQEAMAALERANLALAAAGLTATQRESLVEVGAAGAAKAGQPTTLTPLERADREEAIEDWLDDAGVEEAWEHAPALVEQDFTLDDLASLSGVFDGDTIPVVLTWLGASQAVHGLLAEIHQGSARISKIVKALKQYSFLDQAPVQAVDVHEGIDNTLLILRNKLKTGVRVVRAYSDDLPRIQAHGSALNQVWTNLIDNAIDAMDGRGTLTIRTRREGTGFVMVEIEDDGPGIPQEIQDRIFDAFFTTKAPGKGTGQGLEISWRIVVEHHRGQIKVFSEPGKGACFRVCLPLTPDSDEGAAAVEGAQVGTEEIETILSTTKTIAAVGISSKTDRPAHTVPLYLQKAGYAIKPVNPHIDEVLGVAAVPDLTAAGAVDTVLVFRKSESVPAIIDQAIAAGAKCVWMQPGVLHEEAAETARRAGLRVVMDTCMRTEHRRWLRTRAQESPP